MNLLAGWRRARIIPPRCRFLQLCSHRLAVRTLASHAGNRGSIPRGSAIFGKLSAVCNATQPVGQSALTAASSTRPVAAPAGLWPRIAAGVYDLFLIATVLFIGSFLSIAVTGGEAVSSGNWWYRLYLYGLAGLFNVWFWTHGGQTLGMRAWRLKLVDGTGRPVGTPQAILRYLLAVPAWISVIGLLWCVFHPQKRALHDLGSRTLVVRFEKNAPQD